MNIEQEELDWLAEGEMNSIERADLFARLDQSADGWKRCAIALVEQQLVRGRIKDMVDSGCRCEINESASFSPQAPEAFCELNTVTETNNGSRTKWLSYVVAAILLFTISSSGAFLIGKNQGQQQASSYSAVSTPDDGTSIAPPINVSTSVKRFEELVARTGVSDAKLIGIVRVQSENQREAIVPVLSSPSIEQHIDQGTVRPISQTVRNELREKGWLIKSTRQFISVQSPFGSHRIVPVDLLNYRFVGRQVF